MRDKENEQFKQDVLAKAVPSEPAFWQEPSFVVGGVVVSFAVGALIGAYVTRQK